jgi:GTP diphosphokinase / guanosine-3',5'-bis(diphosphate) 3'-diphosphatase
MPSLKELTVLIKNPEKEGLALIEKAYNFAEKAHKGHARYSGEPFFNHLFETAKILATLGMGPKSISAGLLHDSIEDTETTAEILKSEFGEEILCMVEGVTKLGTLKYRGLKRHVESLRKLFVAIAKDIRVIIIKLSDRLHNMRTLEHVPAHKQKRIAEETLEIYAPLAYRLGMRQVNRELEDLAFPYVYPEQYEQTKELLRQKNKESLKHLEKAHKNLKKSLAKEGLSDFKTDLRIKGLYSLYRKLERKGMDIDKIYDISALRVIVPTITDCYKALGIIHMLWRPLPGRIKDYIAFPKPNGYQSIHTTVLTGDGVIIELQIRTNEMHQNAEYGIASHIGYKQGIGDRRAFMANISWIGQLLSYRYWFQNSRSDETAPEQHSPRSTNIEKNTPEWIRELAISQADVSDPKEFLDHLRADFFEHRVFVFTPNGDVVDLPLTASPIDFAFAIHSDIGSHMAGAKVNGKMATLDTHLNNGDIVEIITKDSAKPSIKWIEFAKTGLAKRKIRSALDDNPK